jgi:hypothetical protein
MTAGIVCYPAICSGRRRVGRLQGGTCGNNGGGKVVALAAARLGGRQTQLRTKLQYSMLN